MCPKVLLVEENKGLAGSIIDHLHAKLGTNTIWVKSYKEARDELLHNNNHFAVALLDLNLPDASMGEAIELIKPYNIPSIAITQEFSDEIQEFIWTKKIVDCVVKESPNAIDYLVDLVGRIERNKDSKILIVDDSFTAREHIKQLLEIHRFPVIEASNGIEALERLAENSDVKLVLTDYRMPGCDGVELTRRIRQQFSIDKLSIIGLSSEGNLKLSLKFMKQGANDFISKPFLSEQFFYRVEQNMRMIERFETLRNVSLTDALTGLKNRRYLFEFGPMLHKNLQRKGTVPVVAMIDIDHFKKVNDTYGHMVGDHVLRYVSSTIKKSFRESDIVARYGGEEFCVVAINMEHESVLRIFDTLRVSLAKKKFKRLSKKFHVTVSMGICTQDEGSFVDMIHEADQKLYRAKESGRNRIVV